ERRYSDEREHARAGEQTPLRHIGGGNRQYGSDGGGRRRVEQAVLDGHPSLCILQQSPSVPVRGQVSRHRSLTPGASNRSEEQRSIGKDQRADGWDHAQRKQGPAPMPQAKRLPNGAFAADRGEAPPAQQAPLNQEQTGRHQQQRNRIGSRQIGAGGELKEEI